MRTTLLMLTALLVTACSADADDAADPRDMCRLVESGELGAPLRAGFPKPGDDGDAACRWETERDDSLRIDLVEHLEPRFLGEQWKVSPRRIADREVYVAARGFTEPGGGGEVLECSAGVAQGDDTVRITLGVDEPRGDLCAELTGLLKKVIPRLA
jgi:hypothetical protein